MKLLNKVLITVMSLIFLMGIIPVSIADESKGSAWMLKEIVDYDAADKIAKANNNRVYSTEATYAPGSFYSKRTYIGPDKNSPKVERGEHLAVRVNWSHPPSIIYEGAAVELNLSFVVVSKRLPNLHFSNSTTAAFDVARIKPGSGTAGRVKFADEHGVSHFKLNRSQYDPIKTTLTADAPTGRKEGDQVALMVTMSTSVGSIGTKYIYEWKAINEESVRAAKNIRATLHPKKVIGSNVPEAGVECVETENWPSDTTESYFPKPSEWHENDWVKFIDSAVCIGLDGAYGNAKGRFPLVDVYQALSAAGAAVKPGLQIWLRRKMERASMEQKWDRFDRYSAFYDCLTYKYCRDLRKIQRKEAR